MKIPPRRLIPICLGWLLAACSAAGNFSSPTIAPHPSPIPATSTFAPTLTVARLDPTRPDPEATLRPTALPRTPVVVIGWDGGQAAMVYDWMAEGQMENFNRLTSCGLRAEYLTSVDPTLSAPGQTSLITGIYPTRTGMVSNAFHNPSDSFYWYRTAFEEPLDQARPIWVAASQAGLTTAALFITSASPAFPGQMADYTVGYGVRDAYSNQVVVDLSPSSTTHQGLESYSPVLGGSFFIPQIARVDLIVTDASDDGQANYDTVWLQSGVSSPPLPLEATEWGSLVLVPNLSAGADFLVQEITPQRVRLYHSAVNHNTAAPRSLLDEINQQFSFFPAPADEYALEHGWITEEDYLWMIERSARWRAQVTGWVYEDVRPDLLLTWLETLDTAGHAFLLTDARQPGFSPGRADQNAEQMLRAAKLADKALGIILQSIDPEKANLLLVADHGMAPIHTNVYINTILERAGLLKLDRRNYVDVTRSRALAVASGGSAHIYINLIGRERDGILSAGDYAGIQSQIVELFRALDDPKTGQPVFQRVLTRQELSELHLDHANAGDIFVQASPGYNLDDWRGETEIFRPVTFFGGHGFDSTSPDMRAIFIACGPDIQHQDGAIPPIKIVDIAPTIADLLPIDSGIETDGMVIQEITR